MHGPDSLRDAAAVAVGAEGVAGAEADASAFVGGDRDQDVDGQLVGVGVVAGDELDPQLLEVGHDDRRPDQAVDLGDDQACSGEGGVAGGGAELGSTSTSSCMPLSTST